MSKDNAKAYMRRMQEDEAFRKAVKAEEDNDRRWAMLQEAGYVFTIPEFKEAQHEMASELGMDDGLFFEA